MKKIINYLLVGLWLIASVVYLSPVSATDLLTFKVFDIPRFQSALSAGNSRSLNNLKLQVSIPEGQLVSDKQIRWNIISLQGKRLKQLIGNQHSVYLLPGKYQVELRIGKFQLTKTVVLEPDRLVKPYFKALLNTQQQSSGRFRQPKAVGQAKLVAIRENQPLFNSLLWEIYRVESGEKRPMGRYHLHTQRITVPVGFYVAVASYNGVVRSRRFWVKKGTTNQVVLAMD